MKGEGAGERSERVPEGFCGAVQFAVVESAASARAKRARFAANADGVRGCFL